MKRTEPGDGLRKHIAELFLRIGGLGILNVGMQLEIDGGGFVFLENIFERNMHDIAPLAQAHEGLVNGDARNPGGEASAALKLVEIAMSLEQRLLLGILGVLLVPGDAER